MKVSAIKIAPNDNVVTVLQEVAAGDAVVFTDNGKQMRLVAKQAVPIFHKISTCSILHGGHVFKYGESIGAMTQPVERGMWISHENITGLPRDYAKELDDE